MFKAKPVAILTLAGLTAAGSVCGCRTPRNQECCHYSAAAPAPHQEVRDMPPGAPSAKRTDDLPTVDFPSDLPRSEPPPDTRRREIARRERAVEPKPQAKPDLDGTPVAPESVEPEIPDAGIAGPLPSDSISDDFNLPADDQADPLANMQNLGAELEFADSGGFGPGERDAGSVIGIDLSGASLTDDDLRMLGRFPNLQKLDLSNTRVSDRALKHLSGQIPLQLLWLNYTQITDAGLIDVAELTSLKSLGLTGTKITDSGLVHLKQLNQLEYLLLSQNEITDDGLEHLAAFSSLEGISLIRTRVTMQGVSRLKRALPNCQIVSDAAKREQQDARPPAAAPPVLPAPEAAVDPTDIHNELQSLRAVPVLDAIVQGVRGPRRFVIAAEPGTILAGEADPAAEQRLLKLLRVLLNDPLALNELGRHYLANARWQEAFAVLDAAVLIAPDEISARYHLAVAAARLGDVETALPHFVETVGPAAAHYNLGIILYEAGELAESQRQLEQAVRENPDLEEAQTWLNDVRRERIARVVRSENGHTQQAHQKTRQVY